MERIHLYSAPLQRNDRTLQQLHARFHAKSTTNKISSLKIVFFHKIFRRREGWKGTVEIDYLLNRTVWMKHSIHRFFLKVKSNRTFFFPSEMRNQPLSFFTPPKQIKPHSTQLRALVLALPSHLLSPTNTESQVTCRSKEAGGAKHPRILCTRAILKSLFPIHLYWIAKFIRYLFLCCTQIDPER